MKTFKNVAAQGELRFVRLPDGFALPENAEPVAPVGAHIIVGHSETGHHHVMTAERTKLYRLPDSILECLLVVEQPDMLTHLRSYDTHEDTAFEAGVYRVITGREHTPEGWRRSQD